MQTGTNILGKRNRKFKYLLSGLYPRRSDWMTLGWFESLKDAKFSRDCLLRRCPAAEFRIDYHPFGVPQSIINEARQ